MHSMRLPQPGPVRAPDSPLTHTGHRPICSLGTQDRRGCPVSVEGLGSDTAAFVSLGCLGACSDRLWGLHRAPVLLLPLFWGQPLGVLPLSSAAPLRTSEGWASFTKAPSHHLSQHRKGGNQGSDKDSDLRASRCPPPQGLGPNYTNPLLILTYKGIIQGHLYA